MMSPAQHERLQTLKKGAWSNDRLLQDYVGKLPLRDTAFIKGFKLWAERNTRFHEVVREKEINRYALECYFLAMRMLPFKWAGLRLGMSEATFDKLLRKLLPENPMLSVDSILRLKVVPELIISELYKYIPALQGTLFSSHDVYCRTLHKILREKYAIEIDETLCKTSVELAKNNIGPKAASFGITFDSITLDPISPRYEVWLRLDKKPLNLSPDRCGLLFYAQNKETLKTFLFNQGDPTLALPELRKLERLSNVS